MERSKGKNTRLVNMLKIENKLLEGSPESILGSTEFVLHVLPFSAFSASPANALVMRIRAHTGSTLGQTHTFLDGSRDKHAWLQL